MTVNGALYGCGGHYLCVHYQSRAANGTSFAIRLYRFRAFVGAHRLLAYHGVPRWLQCGPMVLTKR